jgi:hypothetical protein
MNDFGAPAVPQAFQLASRSDVLFGQIEKTGPPMTRPVFLQQQICLLTAGTAVVCQNQTSLPHLPPLYN